MSPPLRNLILAVAAAAALAGGFFASRLGGARQAAEPAAPALNQVTLKDADGKTRNLGEWNGNVVVLNFWATWCPPCREEIPMFLALQQRYQPQGLQFLGIAIDQPEAVQVFRRNNPFNYPLFVDDAAFKLMDQYGNTAGALPFSVILDRSGKVVARKLGAFRGQDLEELLFPLLSVDKMR
jgi:thiol-disulfide isomerase/thioredoxin